MSKKIVIVLAAIVVIVAGVGGGYYVMSFRNQNSGNPASKLSIPVPLPVSEEKNEVYKDSSGFSFAYPSGIKVNDVTPDNYYSLLTLEKGREAIKITVKDGKASDISFSNGELIGAVTLGGIPAKQYKSGNSLITAALDSGIVYIIEGPKDGSFWENAQNTIVSSFAFSNASAAGSGTNESIDDVSMEEEVVN